MEHAANVSSADTDQGPAANRTSNDGPTARLNVLTTSMGATDPFHAMMLAGYRATEPLGPYASYTAQQVAVAQNEHIKQCAAELKGEMATITGRLDRMSSLLDSTSDKIVELEQRDPVAPGPQEEEEEEEEEAEANDEEDMEERLLDAIRGAEEKAEERLLDAVRMLEEKTERRILDAIRASEDQTARRFDRKLEQLENKLGSLDRWVGYLKCQADDLKTKTGGIERTLGDMEKELKALEKKLEDATHDPAKQTKTAHATTNGPVNGGYRKNPVEELELAYKELEELTFGSHPRPVQGNFLSAPPAPFASNQAQAAFPPGATGPTIGRLEFRRVGEQTVRGFDGLINWIQYIKLRTVRVERCMARRENSRLGFDPNIDYLDVPYPDGSNPGSWQVDGKDFPALRNVATITNLTPAQCAYALKRYGYRDIPESLQARMALLFKEIGVNVDVGQRS